ncbi:hypothetical protein DFA_07419 [Cavenderia fasciculata]|uniref:Myb-like domain-containing protein n=1 Tax=Cavenderia fasciculata TaxID=261658 RepID=F4PWD2_CACFS|nr:uncharacterized protein DFA_07419 [Cavenderia fasciculata]EGG20296.1 hypothetical protein DFA_07419 [Cavenderia fasciculata]|eukprot:XP_004367279.1 hypothetical protein DFA_07419 [Cavenderia fasciculata]
MAKSFSRIEDDDDDIEDETMNVTLDLIKNRDDIEKQRETIWALHLLLADGINIHSILGQSKGYQQTQHFTQQFTILKSLNNIQVFIKEFEIDPELDDQRLEEFSKGLRDYVFLLCYFGKKRDTSHRRVLEAWIIEMRLRYKSDEALEENTTIDSLMSGKLIPSKRVRTYFKTLYNRTKKNWQIQSQEEMEKLGGVDFIVNSLQDEWDYFISVIPPPSLILAYRQRALMPKTSFDRIYPNNKMINFYKKIEPRSTIQKPRVKWTPEEELLLMRGMFKYDTQWAKIYEVYFSSTEFSGRTPVNLKDKARSAEFKANYAEFSGSHRKKKVVESEDDDFDLDGEDEDDEEEEFHSATENGQTGKYTDESEFDYSDLEKVRRKSPKKTTTTNNNNNNKKQSPSKSTTKEKEKDKQGKKRKEQEDDYEEEEEEEMEEEEEQEEEEEEEEEQDDEYSSDYSYEEEEEEEDKEKAKKKKGVMAPLKKKSVPKKPVSKKLGAKKSAASTTNASSTTPSSSSRKRDEYIYNSDSEDEQDEPSTTRKKPSPGVAKKPSSAPPPKAAPQKAHKAPASVKKSKPN